MLFIENVENGKFSEVTRDGKIYPENEPFSEFAIRVGGHAIDDVFIEKHERSQYAEEEQ